MTSTTFDTDHPTEWRLRSAGVYHEAWFAGAATMRYRPLRVVRGAVA